MPDQVISPSALLVPVLLVAIVGPVIAGCFLLHARRTYASDHRSPLARNLLRPAGYGITTRLMTLRDETDQRMLELVLVPLLLMLGYLLLVYSLPAKSHAVTTAVMALVGLGRLARTINKLIRLQRQIRQLRLGLDAEMAAGQELDQLMRQGAAVFHDLSAEYGNIDHVVICRAGVFAVETKGRSKPQRDQVENSANVTFDGTALRFPTWSETKPLAQAERQAQWLSRWLSRAVGSKVAVTPVLMLPGWYVRATGRSAVRVMNPRQKYGLLRASGPPLDDALFQAITHAVEERCRDVEPYCVWLMPEKPTGSMA